MYSLHLLKGNVVLLPRSRYLNLGQRPGEVDLIAI